MSSRASSRPGLLLIGQCLLLLFGFVLLYAAPPARGQMLLIPMTGAARGALAAEAVSHGARLVAAGPWPGSLLVDGQRSSLSAPLLRRGILSLSARAGGCVEQGR